MSAFDPPGTEPIPSVPGLPVLGNVREVRAATAVEDLMRLTREHGPIFELHFPGYRRRSIIVSGLDFVDELCDESRFRKLVGTQLEFLRVVGGDGLFTSETRDPNWRKAHAILLPAFSMRAVQGYVPQMTDIARQLVDKWGRLNPDDEIDVPADMTRLTFDTIGLCGFNYRFNSFYREEPHPFIAAMVRTLTTALAQGSRLPIQDRLAVRERRQLEADAATMNSLVDSLIAERRAEGANGTPPSDLLQAMLTGVDKDTGEGLDDLNIRYQINTFLIAGHETTSGLLSFAIYFLLKNPDVCARAQEEVDRILGGDLDVVPTPAQLGRLRYLSQILNETLRLWPTAPGFVLTPLDTTVLAGKYALHEDDALTVLSLMLHRDPAIWGENAEEFDPDRFAPEASDGRPPNAYKPFGNGMRACIGRQFALLEATVLLALVLQRFELVDHTGYQLRIRETLTLKADGLRIRVRPRATRAAVAVADPEPEPAETPAATGHGTPLLVLYGSNLGTAEEIAREIADGAAARGFAATVAPLDDYAERLPSDGAVVIATSSYNGKPPDNAARFCEWLTRDDLAADALAGVRYAVFGCGDHNWASTFQAVPTLVDAQLAARGATRIADRGAGDAADDFDGQYRAWYGPLWNEVATALDLEPAEATPQGHRYQVEVLAESVRGTFVESLGAKPLAVLENRELQRAPDGRRERSTRHVELALPDGVTFAAGDHLAILPRNGDMLVQHALAHFGLREDDQIRIRGGGGLRSVLPLDRPIAVSELLAGYVELQEPATRAQLAVLSRYAASEPDQERLRALAGDDDASVARYRDEVLTPRMSLLDMLDELSSCALPFNVFLELVPLLRPRFYSISSSPLRDGRRCSITVAALEAPARSGQGAYRGVCSTYLATQPAGALVYGFVRKPSMPFHPPEDATVPMIMVGPGTGVAPFRGFLQERAALKAQGQDVGRSLLFFGCRDPERDSLYEEELRGVADQGVAEVVTAFSRVQGQPRAYVQERIREHADEVWELLQQGAVVYVCGDAARVAPGIRAAFAAIFRDRTGASGADAEAWLAGLTDADRYLEDIWATA